MIPFLGKKLAALILFFSFFISISCKGNEETEYVKTGAEGDSSAVEYAINIAVEFRQLVCNGLSSGFTFRRNLSYGYPDARLYV